MFQGKSKKVSSKKILGKEDEIIIKIHSPRQNVDAEMRLKPGSKNFTNYLRTISGKSKKGKKYKEEMKNGSKESKIFEEIFNQKSELSPNFQELDKPRNLEDEEKGKGEVGKESCVSPKSKFFGSYLDDKAVLTATKALEDKGLNKDSSSYFSRANPLEKNKGKIKKISSQFSSKDLKINIAQPKEAGGINSPNAKSQNSSKRISKNSNFKNFSGKNGKSSFSSFGEDQENSSRDSEEVTSTRRHLKAEDPKSLNAKKKIFRKKSKTYDNLQEELPRKRRRSGNPQKMTDKNQEFDDPESGIFKFLTELGTETISKL